MSDGTKWHYVSTREAAEIRRYMETRVAEIWEGLKVFGLTQQRADCALSAAGEEHSVDLVLWSAALGTEILVECKWTRRSLAIALAEAKKSWKWMRPALKRNGRWLRGRKPVKAEAMGAMVITPGSWKLVVQGYDGWQRTFPQTRYVAPAKRSGASGTPGASNWEHWRRGYTPGTPFWWPSGKRRQ